MTPEELGALKDLIDAVGQAQALSQANHYILLEIVRDIARTKSDPDKYIAGMFERISARADQAPLETEAHTVSAEFRLIISKFFSLAGKRLQK